MLERSSLIPTRFCLGERLESIDRQRTRASEAKDLVLYFMDFNSNAATTNVTSETSIPSSTRLDLVKCNNGWDGKHKVFYFLFCILFYFYILLLLLILLLR